MTANISGGAFAQEQVPKLVTSAELGRIIDPEPLAATGRNWTRFAGPAVSLLILLAVVYQLRQTDIGELVALMPLSVSFWLAFIFYYTASPLSEWIIFRRLWHLPVSGFLALLRKLVSNEILLGYLGEVYFYAWARRHAQITTAPFGAIKDVTILSALTGNIVTLVMLIFAAPLIRSLHLVDDSRAFIWSIGFVLGTSVLAMLFRKRLFTLPRKALWGVTALHFARIVATTGLAAYMWHLILPDVSISWWLLLATFRLLLSRLPFIPNKDVVFAGLAVFLVGRDTEIVAAMTLMAGLILAAHLVVGGALGISGLMNDGDKV